MKSDCVEEVEIRQENTSDDGSVEARPCTHTETEEYSNDEAPAPNDELQIDR